MKHHWFVEVIDSAHLGINTFWKCKNCDACAGLSWGEIYPIMNPFYADGTGLQLTNDCVESKMLIQKHLEDKNYKWANRKK